MNADSLMIEQAFVTLGGRQILQGAAVKSTVGRITGLLGRNGSGKSTLLKMLFGSLGGEKVVSAGNKVCKTPAYSIAGLVNYLPQSDFLLSGLRMQDAMDLFAVEKNDLLAYFPELGKDIGLYSNQLSGGQRRLWQCVLLILAPTRFTLLDEPFSHLAPLYIERLKKLLLDTRDRKGFILTDHMYEPLLEVSSDIWLMKQGQCFQIAQRGDLVLHGYVSHLV